MWASGFVSNWGSTAAERRQSLACDMLVDAPDQVLYRAVPVNAPAGVVFRWLCQLTQAPYSYDRLDNGGRRSPPQLTDGADLLTVGQRAMRIFLLVSFEPGEHITLELRGHRLFGDLGVTYLVVPVTASSCRLLVKIVLRSPTSIVGRLGARFLPLGDLVMMRRQLLNLKALAEAAALEPG
jgi:hypothetical protein